MSQIDDGGSAFPVYVPEGPLLADGSPEHPAYTKPGMSLRDYLAGQALAGLLADPNVVLSASNAAIVAYRYTDAMLAARRLTKPE